MILENLKRKISTGEILLKDVFDVFHVLEASDVAILKLNMKELTKEKEYYICDNNPYTRIIKKYFDNINEIENTDVDDVENVETSLVMKRISDIYELLEDHRCIRGSNIHKFIPFISMPVYTIRELGDVINKICELCSEIKDDYFLEIAMTEIIPFKITDFETIARIESPNLHEHEYIKTVWNIILKYADVTDRNNINSAMYVYDSLFVILPTNITNNTKRCLIKFLNIPEFESLYKTSKSSESDDDGIVMKFDDVIGNKEIDEFIHTIDLTEANTQFSLKTSIVTKEFVEKVMKKLFKKKTFEITFGLTVNELCSVINEFETKIYGDYFNINGCTEFRNYYYEDNDSDGKLFILFKIKDSYNKFFAIHTDSDTKEISIAQFNKSEKTSYYIDEFK